MNDSPLLLEQLFAVLEAGRQQAVSKESASDDLGEAFARFVADRFNH